MTRLQYYFPELTPKQMQQFADLSTHFLSWNARINLISRKDSQNLCLHHVLHSLSVAKVVPFQPQSEVLDVGTGGGFPGIPLAILFPETQFVLVDSIAKKIRAVEAIATAIGLPNVKVQCIRAEVVAGTYDFVVARGVTSLPRLYEWTNDKIKKTQAHSLPNGILYLKGGPIEKELVNLRLQCQCYPICHFFEEPFFATKYVAHLFPKAID